MCKNIKENGERDDIIDLINMTDQDNSSSSVPVIISTLTKKFYFTSSKLRGHTLDLHNNHRHIKKSMKDVHQKISEVVQKGEIRKASSIRRGRTASPAGNEGSTVERGSSFTVADGVERPKKLISKKEVAKVKKTSSVTKKPPWKY